MLINTQDKLISELENTAQKQNEKIADLQFVIKEHGRETVDNHSGRIETLETELNSLKLFDNENIENDTDLTNVTGTYDISSKNTPDAHFINKGHNSVRPTIARKSRILASTNIAFSAYLDHDLDLLTTGHLVKCNQALLKVGNAYNTITGLFTVPKTRVYLLTFTINTHSDRISEIRTYVKLVSNNKNIIDAVFILKATGRDQMGGNTAIVQLSAGESVWLEVFGTTNGQLQSDGNYRYVSFSGVLLF